MRNRLSSILGMMEAGKGAEAAVRVGGDVRVSTFGPGDVSTVLFYQGRQMWRAKHVVRIGGSEEGRVVRGE